MGKSKKNNQPILEFLNDMERARQYGIAAKVRVEDCFTLRICIANYKALFQKLI